VAGDQPRQGGQKNKAVVFADDRYLDLSTQASLDFERRGQAAERAAEHENFFEHAVFPLSFHCGSVKASAIKASG